MSSDLPTGTVTFLFTDIEGSTRLWQKYPDTMPDGLARHHSILNEEISAHHGYVFQIIGDAFCAAFPTARDGLEAALAAQRALRDASWGNMDAIRVRMALHTGTAEVQMGEHTSGEYVSGLTLSRAARLLSSGHGGQILLSLTTTELVCEHLPSQTVLHDLGAHRLKDLIRPEHIYQAVAPDLSSDFPTLKTLDMEPNNLPIQLTSFIGREQEMRRVREMLNSSRQVTLTGAGGCGKTRLALQVAADIIDEFPDGVWFVELATLTDPALIPHSVATAMGLQLQSGTTIQLALMEYLRGRKCLLLIDNCEHLIDASARFVDTLLHTCPNLGILVTGREGLSIAGEVIYRVPPLGIPPLQAQDSQAFTQYESVRLFVDRAQAIQPNFVVTQLNRPAIARICHRLDGIPLAIELAAARVNVLSVEQISERLSDCFRLLTGGSRTALPRQQTLRALIDWSYSLLSIPDRTLLARLSIFAGGWTLEAAESICAGDGIDSFEILDGLQSLAAKSLVVSGEGVDGRMRFHLLETIRQYAHEELVNSGQFNLFGDRHLDWYLEYEEQTRPKLFSSEQVITLNRLDAEHDNFRAALTWSMENSIEKGLQLAAGLYRFWRLRGYWFERLDWLNKLLSLPDAMAPTSMRAYALIARGDMELSQGEYGDAEKSFSESLQIYRTLCDQAGTAMALGEMARLSIQQRKLLRAAELSQEGLDISRKKVDRFQISQSLNRLAYVLQAQGHQGEASQLLEESVVLFSHMVDLGSITHFFASPDTQNAYFSLATSEQDQGRFEKARKVFEDGLVFFRKTGSAHEIAWFLRHLAYLSLREGDLAQAQALYQESLQIVHELRDHYCTAHTMDGLAQVENGKGNYDQAGSLAQQALNLCSQVGSKPQIARVQRILGLAKLHVDRDEAEKLLKSSLLLRIKLQNKNDLAESFEAIAKMNVFDREFGRAAQLFAATSAFRESLVFSMTSFEKSEFECGLNGLRAELGEGSFKAAWEQGRAMTWEQAADLALADKHV